MADCKEWSVVIHDPILGPVATKIKQRTCDSGTDVDIDSLVVLRKNPKNGKYPAAGEAAFVMLYTRDADSEYDWDVWEWALPHNVCFVSNHRNYSDRGCEAYSDTGWSYSDFDTQNEDFDDIRNKAVDIISYRFGDELDPCDIVYEYCNRFSSYENTYERSNSDSSSYAVVLISEEEMKAFFDAHENDDVFDDEAAYNFVDNKLTDEVLENATKPTYGPLKELPDWAWTYVSLYDHSGQYWYRCGTASTEGWDTTTHAGIMYAHPNYIKEHREAGTEEEKIKEYVNKSIDRMCHVFSGALAHKVVGVSVAPTGYYDNDSNGGDVEESDLIFEDEEEELADEIAAYEKVGYERVPFSVTAIDEDD